MNQIEDLYDVIKCFCQEHEIELKSKNTDSQNKLRFFAKKEPISIFADISPTKEKLLAQRMISIRGKLFRESAVYFKRENDQIDYSSSTWVANAAITDYLRQFNRVLREEVDSENVEHFIFLSTIHDRLKKYYNSKYPEIQKNPENLLYVGSEENRYQALDCLLLLGSFYPWSRKS